MAPKANAAQRTIIAQMDTCIDEHGLAKKRLDECELPSGAAACGAPPSVVHIHHQALCTLVGGQRILLQERRDRLEQDMLDDDDLARRRNRPRPQAETSDLLVDRKRQILRANGPVAMMLAIVAAAGAIAWAAHNAADLLRR
jgi:hypothetical protein